MKYIFTRRFSTYIHYRDIIMGAMASQITSLTIVYSTVYSGANQRKHQCFASLGFLRGTQRSPVNSPHKWPVTRKMCPFDDVIMLIVRSKNVKPWSNGFTYNNWGTFEHMLCFWMFLLKWNWNTMLWLYFSKMPLLIPVYLRSRLKFVFVFYANMVLRW